ncbi:agouti-signaling protein-like [Anarrhichthys ocellatus]|uniref:agouti-signaling protein-like n=1 Tax=Anarrhichthys ocellatus TaxID=433405 RepID=UPI0012EDC6E8|nr:agouti-signaling protein-like [Anarrhichthys ocellatus]
MVSFGMKLAVVCFCFCILHLTAVSAGQYGRKSEASAEAPQKPQPLGTGSLIKGRQRPLFARRGQYERQRIHTSKSNVVPVPPNGAPPPSKVAPKPVKPKCSQITQSCLPQFGCCNSNATCHCRFFNAICFCRRSTGQN